MIIQPDGNIRFLTVAEHLQRKAVVYQDSERTVSLYPNKRQSLVIQPGGSESVYIDLFALRFGQKEQLRRKTASGWESIQYGCSRMIRDGLLFLPLNEIVDNAECQCCPQHACQYWSHPTGVKGRYAFTCILIRYRALGVFDQRMGLTLEEVGRIYGCTRERIRQIQVRAMERMRHHTRLEKVRVFHEHILDYRDYTTGNTLEAVG